VLDGDLIPEGEGAILGEYAAVQCKVIGHSTGHCAKTAEPIDVPFCTKTLVGLQNHVSDMGTDPQKEKGPFLGVVWAFKNIGNLCCSHCCSIAVTFVATGIIQSPIMTCSRWDHSVCQAIANSIFGKCMGAGSAA